MNYAAAKAGMIGFTKALALEGASRGISVNVVAPGYTPTAMVSAVPADILQAIIGARRRQTSAPVTERFAILRANLSGLAHRISSGTAFIVVICGRPKSRHGICAKCAVTIGE